MFLSKLASSTKKVGDPCLRYYIYKVDISLKPTIQSILCGAGLAKTNNKLDARRL